MPEASTTTAPRGAAAAPTHAPSARHLLFNDIGGDAIVLKDGSARAVLEVTPVCLAGYTEQEHELLTKRYAEFLNALTFPVQILVKSKVLDMDGYLRDLRDRETGEERPFFRGQLKEYRELLEKFLPYSGYGIMDRRIYIVIPYELPAEAIRATEPASGFFALFAPNRVLRDAEKRSERLAQLRNGLNDCVRQVIDAFAPLGLPIRRLETEELISLFVRVYHPGTADHDHDDLFDQVTMLTSPTD